ncbi:MAG: hypothetical protein LBL82_07160 [Oscillospiraceae bacterium]|nr:hypothetical protein [Oscillospiraceae bacterium]
MNNYRTSQSSPANFQAVMSFFIAVAALIFSFIPLVSLILAIISIGMGYIAVSQGNKGAGTAGIAVSVVAILLSVIIGASCSSVFGALGATDADAEIEDDNSMYTDDYDAIGEGDFVSDADLTDSSEESEAAE